MQLRPKKVFLIRMHHPELIFLVSNYKNLLSRYNHFQSFLSVKKCGCILLLRKILEVEDLLIPLSSLANCLVDSVTLLQLLSTY